MCVPRSQRQSRRAAGGGADGTAAGEQTVQGRARVKGCRASGWADTGPGLCSEVSRCGKGKRRMPLRGVLDDSHLSQNNTGNHGRLAYPALRVSSKRKLFRLLRLKPLPS